MNKKKQKSFIPVNGSIPLFLILMLSVISVSKTYSQQETVYVQSDIPPGAGNLNTAVKNAADAGKLSSTVFVLEPNGCYILTDSILVPVGEHLTIIAPEPGSTQETAPPQILSATGSNEYISPVRVAIKCFGNITLKNLWLLFANTNGWQTSTNIQIENGPEFINEQVGVFENVIFDYSKIPADGSGAVGIASKHFKGIFKNCYWKNCTDSHFRYYGRAVSFPYYYNASSDWHIDSLVFENCTFANIGYVLSQQQSNDGKFNYADYVRFNHCTFLNTMMYTLQSGWWYKSAVTNSIFVNTYMFGYIPAYEGFGYTGGELNGGTIRIDGISSFGFEVPFNEQDRRILFTNSSYYIEKWLSDWMYNNPYSIQKRQQGRLSEIPVPQPILNPTTFSFFDSTGNGNKIFPYMNRAALFDSVNPGFILPPTDSSAIKEFLIRKWDSGGADYHWPWKPENSINRIWPLEENLAYSNDILKTAGMSGFPLGDLYRWWPEEYAKWSSLEENENARISYWLETGKDSVLTDVKEKTDLIKGFELLQNYPNPFNPKTVISYKLKVRSEVGLKIYDILGREIVTLINEVKDAGDYTIEWDGRNSADLLMSSGVYFYQLKCENGFVDTKKMVLMK